MTILVKSSDLGRMKNLDADVYHPTLVTCFGQDDHAHAQMMGSTHMEASELKLFM